jgi:transposase-like protein
MDHQEKILKERKVWEKRIIEFESSGASVAEFAKLHGLSVHQFYYWKNKLSKPKAPPAVAPVPVVKPKNLIKVVPSIERPSTIPDPIWLAKFLRAMHEVY